MKFSLIGKFPVPAVLPALFLSAALSLAACGGSGGVETTGAAAAESSPAAGESAGIRSGSETAAEMPAGTYWFAESGGSGRTRIALKEVTEENGQTEAEIVFSSGRYTKVVSGGAAYGKLQDPDLDPVSESAFRIPVMPGEKTEITATTTAMSVPHDISYTIFVGTREEALHISGEATEEGNLGALERRESGADDGSSGGSSCGGDTGVRADTGASQLSALTPPKLPGLDYERALPLEFADQFAVFSYSGGYRVLSVRGVGDYLLVPEGKTAPAGIPEDLRVLQQPLDKIYDASTSSVSFFDALNAMDRIAFLSLRRDGWAIDAPKQAYDAGTLQYGGSYSAPDYELLLRNGCDLAVESTMILHSPKVREKLESLGIPVLIDRSSYEEDVFGREEWIKAYGALLGADDAAQAFFEEQKAVLEEENGQPDTGKTAAFFAIRSDGTAVVRSGSDLVPDMIRKAGGRYVFDSLESGTASHAVALTFEEFYAEAKDADYLVYNGTIETPLAGTADLLSLNPLFADFRAVQENRVYQADQKWYQSTASMGNMLRDFRIMFTDGDPQQLTFLEKLD